MTRPKTVRAPTTASLPNNLRIPSTTPSIVKAFGKLSRQALIDLAFLWLDYRNVQNFQPYLKRDENENEDDEETSPYTAAKDVEEVREAYQDLQDRKGGKREVIERMLEGDWRHGITLRQLAMVDLRYMDDHPSTLRWTALELSRISTNGSRDAASAADNSACLPRVHASTFLKNLQLEISPLVKAHYHLSRSAAFPLTFLRIFVTDSPYQYPRQSAEVFADPSRVIYVAFPDSCPFIYTSITSSTGAKAAASKTGAVATDARSLQRIVRDAIPKALSKSQERYTLKATSLTAKNLQALLALRGPGRSNNANGTFSIFADAVVEGSPLDPRPSNTVSPEDYASEHHKRKKHASKDKENADGPSAQDDERPHQSLKSNLASDSPASKKRKLAIDSRFGTAGTALSSAPLDRLDIRLLDSPVAVGENSNHDGGDVSNEQTQPPLSLTFSGTDIISGIRKLAELGIVQPERMPSWMTGEEAVSVAVVRGGKRILKDSG